MRQSGEPRDTSAAMGWSEPAKKPSLVRSAFRRGACAGCQQSRRKEGPSRRFARWLEGCSSLRGDSVPRSWVRTAMTPPFKSGCFPLPHLPRAPGRGDGSMAEVNESRPYCMLCHMHRQQPSCVFSSMSKSEARLGVPSSAHGFVYSDTGRRV